MCLPCTLIYAYIDRQCRHMHTNVSEGHRSLHCHRAKGPCQLRLCGRQAWCKRFLSFLEPSRERSHNESEVAEVSLLAVQIVITCTASNVKIIHDCTIFMFCSDGERAEVSQNSLQHINSCLKGSCWHTTRSVWKYPKVKALLGPKVSWTMTEVTFEACCVTCGAFAPWHL